MDLFTIVLIPFLFLLFRLIEVNLKYGFNILLYEMKINVRSIIEDEIIRLLELLKGGTECEIIDLADFSRLLNKNRFC
jgi:alpha-N-acetylglucosamine transferase